MVYTKILRVLPLCQMCGVGMEGEYVEIYIDKRRAKICKKCDEKTKWSYY